MHRPDVSMSVRYGANLDLGGTGRRFRKATVSREWGVLCKASGSMMMEIKCVTRHAVIRL